MQNQASSVQQGVANMEYTRNGDPNPNYTGNNVVLYQVTLPDLCEQQVANPDCTELNSALLRAQVLDSQTTNKK
jgi:hypothetical protein